MVETNPKKLYIGNIPKEYEEEDIRREFNPFGRIVQIEFKGRFAFVEFDSSSAAEEALEKLSGARRHGERLQVRAYRHVSHRPEVTAPGASYVDESRDRGVGLSKRTGHRVAVLGINERTSWQDLKDFGREVGEVNFADVYTGSDGYKKGILEYNDIHSINSAIRQLSGRNILGNQVRVVPVVNSSSNESSSLGGPTRYDPWKAERHSPGRIISRYEDHREARSRSKGRGESWARRPSNAYEYPARVGGSSDPVYSRNRPFVENPRSGYRYRSPVVSVRSRMEVQGYSKCRRSYSVPRDHLQYHHAQHHRHPIDGRGMSYSKDLEYDVGFYPRDRHSSYRSYKQGGSYREDPRYYVRGSPRSYSNASNDYRHHAPPRVGLAPHYDYPSGEEPVPRMIHSSGRGTRISEGPSRRSPVTHHSKRRYVDVAPMMSADNAPLATGNSEPTRCSPQRSHRNVGSSSRSLAVPSSTNEGATVASGPYHKCDIASSASNNVRGTWDENMEPNPVPEEGSHYSRRDVSLRSDSRQRYRSEYKLQEGHASFG